MSRERFEQTVLDKEGDFWRLGKQLGLVDEEYCELIAKLVTYDAIYPDNYLLYFIKRLPRKIAEARFVENEIVDLVNFENPNITIFLLQRSREIVARSGSLEEVKKALEQEMGGVIGRQFNEYNPNYREQLNAFGWLAARVFWERKRLRKNR